MKISIFGLGYVGQVCAACVAKIGHEVVGVDVNRVKIENLAAGKASIVEKDIDEAVAEAVASGKLTATADVERAVRETELSLICVGTPSRTNGSLDVSAVETVARQIGEAIKKKGSYHAVVVRSTVLPGTIRGKILPILEAATGGKLGVDFGLAGNPEFMREGTAVADFYDPPKTVIGELDARTAEAVAKIYEGLPGPVFRVPLEVGELVKYADNTWHALKVSFGNEVGAICKSVGVDSHALMEVFCADRKLNISPAYLKPGFAFGGSCLPKDTRALAHFGVSRDLDLPVLSNVMRSNRRQVDRGVDWILSTGKRSIAFLGFSFKAGTDDLRESPFVEVIERLIGKGCSIKIFDKNVQLARLLGANRDYLYGVIPHIAELMVDSLDKALEGADVVVVTANSPDYRDATKRLTERQVMLDFARLPHTEALGERYHGYLW